MGLSCKRLLALRIVVSVFLFNETHFLAAVSDVCLVQTSAISSFYYYYEEDV